MSISNPTQLLDAFKKSGEFDRLRRDLLVSFQNGEGIGSFIDRVDDIIRKKLSSDQRLQYMPSETVHRELQQELDRYPIVERAVAEVNMLSDQSFMTGIRNSIQKILREDKAKGGPNSEKAGVTDQSSPVRPPQSSTPEGPSAIRKLGTGSQRPESAPRSQSPDSMKMSTPEPPEPSNKPTPI